MGVVFTVRSASPDVWGQKILSKIKNRIEHQSPEYMPAYKALKDFCDAELVRPPYTVMDKKKIPPSGSKHDYVSMGRYWWPNPDTPDGLPYIRKDGQSNPEIYELDRERMGKMMKAVSQLSLMYYYSEDEKYAAKATDLLRVWFLNEETKMNPDMQFGQYVPGQNDEKGRKEGIIDTYEMVEMLTGVGYLEKSNSFTKADKKGLQKWFGHYLDWILTSELGIAERNTVNNHAIAYDAQVVAYAQFIGRKALEKKTLDEFLSQRIFTQVKPDGSQPRELARETGFGYSVFNINHMLDMCMLAGKKGAGIFKESSTEKSSIRGAISYMSQYLGQPQSAFPYKQLKSWDSVQNALAWIMLRASFFDDDPCYMNAFNAHNTSDSAYIGYLLYNR